MSKKKENTEEVKTNEKVENKFKKSQIISSKRFKDRKDALSSILEDDKDYSINEVEKLYKNFMKGDVK